MVKNLEAVKGMGKTIGKVGKFTGIGLANALGITYAAPTLTRIFYEKYEFPGFIVPLISYFANIGIMLPAYNGLDSSYKYIALAPIATNIFSGLYEWFMYERNKTKSASAKAAPNCSPTPSPAPSPLETRVETPAALPKIDTSPPKEKIPDPWGQEFGEIKSIAYYGREK